MAGSSGTGRAQRRRCLPCEPLGGRIEVRQGAASVRARCRADGGPERGLAAQPCAGAVQRRRRISRCTDRSAGGCADRRTFVTTRARACGGLDAAEASPRRCASWRSRGRRWRGPSARATARPCRLAAGAAARSLRHAGPGWQRRLRPCARCESALHIATDPRRRGGCQAGGRPPPTRPARQPSRARDPCHAWQGHCVLWYGYGNHGLDHRAGHCRPLRIRS